MTPQEEYKICQKRGHCASATGFENIHKWDICKFCKTWYREEIKRTLVEENIPDEPK